MELIIFELSLANEQNEFYFYPGIEHFINKIKMSFWDNNKDSILKAGKNTAKGIGRGSVALGKAGYRTYKNSDARRHDLSGHHTGWGSATGHHEEDHKSTTAPKLRYQDPLTFGAPPKRDVDLDGKNSSSKRTSQHSTQPKRPPRPVPQAPDENTTDLPPSYEQTQNESGSVYGQGTSVFETDSIRSALPRENNPPLPTRRKTQNDSHSPSPPPPPRRNHFSLSGSDVSSTSLMNLRSTLDANVPSLPQRPSGSEGPLNEPKKIPPQKPSKKGLLTTGGSSDKGDVQTTNSSVPNFAEEIAAKKKLREHQQSDLLYSSSDPQQDDFNETKPPKSKVVPPKPSELSGSTISGPEDNQTTLSNRIGLSSGKLPTTEQPPRVPQRHYKRASPPVSTDNEPKFDLELITGWFLHKEGPPQVPKCFSGLIMGTSLQEQRHVGINGESIVRNIRKISVRLKDLSIVRYTISWNNDDINTTKVEGKEYIQSPITIKKLSREVLESYSEKFGIHIASWCERKIGQKVGSGECWDLSYNALEKGCGNFAFVSTYTHHGYPIYSTKAAEGGLLQSDVPVSDSIRRGDIIQFKEAKLFDSKAGKYLQVGMPDHTCIVLENEGNVLSIAEQNTNGVKIVQRGEINLQDLYDGSLVVYRPVPKEWGGDL